MVISAVIPAYNEENTIPDVIRTASCVEEIYEIIVVNDGSIDNTGDIARKNGAKVVTLNRNMGKGAAVKAGVDSAEGDIILLLDADLIGLTPLHIKKLLEPMLEDMADMTVGIFSNGRFTTDIAQKIAPSLSGQRAIKRFVFTDIGEMDTMGYGIEAALTIHAQKNRLRVTEIILEDVTHIMKEEKLGLLPGLAARMKMYWHIIKEMRLARR